MEELIKYIETKIQQCTDMQNMEREKWAFIQCLKEARKQVVILPVVSNCNKTNEDPIIGVITGTGFTTPSDHGILKLEVRYGHYKIEKWKTGDKVELVIVD